MQTITIADLTERIRETLERAKPVAITAGQCTTALQEDLVPCTRSRVKRILDNLAKTDEVGIEYWPVVRNGHEVPKAAHYYLTSRDVDLGRTEAEVDPFAGFDDPKDPFEK